jgi:hypothetical protein
VQVFFEYFGFPCQLLFHKFLHRHNHRGWHNRPIGGRSAEWTQLDSTSQPIWKKMPMEMIQWHEVWDGDL